MAASPFVLSMDAFWQVLAVSVVLLFVLPLRLSHIFAWLYLAGAFVSVLSVIGFGDSAGLELINAQAVPALAVALLFVVRMGVEDRTDRYLLGLLFGAGVRVLSPVSGIDQENAGQSQRQPQNPDEQQDHRHGQEPREYTVIPDPEQVDADTMPGGQSIEDLVDEIDEHRE